MESFNKIIGYENIKLELKRIADQLNYQDKYKKLGVKTTRGLLLEGEPGVGKTLMASCLCEACTRKIYIIRKDLPEKDFIKYIKKTFDDAKQNVPSIVYLDDIDKYSDCNDSHRNTEEFVTIQSCIDDCADVDVFVVATANEIDVLPKSLVRPGRFDKIITINNPKDDDAENICEYYLKQKSLDKDIDVPTIARLLDGRSIAELENVLNEAGIYAAYANRKTICMQDVIDAFLRKVYKAPEILKINDEEYLESIAIHEAGHLTVSELLDPGSVNLATIKKYDSKAGGFVAFKNNKNYWLDVEYQLNRIKTLLGGRAAVEIIKGNVSVGCDEDLERASRILERLFHSDGIYGLEHLRASHNENYSEITSDRRLIVIHKELNKIYQDVKELLIANKNLLDTFTKQLLDLKTLTYIDIQKIKEGEINESTNNV